MQHSGGVAELRAEFEVNNARLREDLQGQLWEYYGALRDPTTSLKERIDRIEEKLEDLDGQAPSNDTAKNSLVPAMDQYGVDSRMSSLGGRVSKLEQRVADASERQTRELEAMSKERAQHFALLKSRLDRQEAAQAELAKLADGQEGSFDGFKSDLEGRLRKELQALQTQLKDSLDKDHHQKSEERSVLKESLMQLFTGLGHELSALRQQANGDLQSLAARFNTIQEDLKGERVARKTHEELIGRQLADEITVLKEQASNDRSQVDSRLASCAEQLQSERQTRERAGVEFHEHTAKLDSELRKASDSMREERAARQKQVDDLMDKLSCQEEAQAAEIVRLNQKLVSFDKKLADEVQGCRADVQYMSQELRRLLDQEKKQRVFAEAQLQEQQSQALKDMQQQIQKSTQQAMELLHQQILQETKKQESQLQQHIEKELQQQVDEQRKQRQREEQQLKQHIDRQQLRQREDEQQVNQKVSMIAADVSKALQESTDATVRLDALAVELKDIQHKFEQESSSKQTMQKQMREEQAGVESLKHSVQDAFSTDMKALKDGIDSLRNSIQVGQHIAEQGSSLKQQTHKIPNGHPPQDRPAAEPVASTAGAATLHPTSVTMQAPWRAACASPAGIATPPASPGMLLQRSMSLGSGLLMQSHPESAGSPMAPQRVGPLLRPSMRMTLVTGPTPPATPPPPGPGAPIQVAPLQRSTSLQSLVPVLQPAVLTVAKARPVTPPALVVSCPSATGIPPISGEYLLIPGERPNGMPLWKLRGGEMWFYFGTNQRWYVGGRDAKDWKFQCQAGFIYSEPEAHGASPDRVAGGWARFQNGIFVADPSITVKAAL
eukprot:TRINITY_DN17749_c0_g1_i1.p1 TRINITY_DN17749_c0_g1~~TRINITY_DN17749_c0_g1_i1.p1  ORF type:complete len:837 (+),score=222.06 TRINITY_DN17749_c0_g1_i1:49-2559(+)